MHGAARHFRPENEQTQRMSHEHAPDSPLADAPLECDADAAFGLVQAGSAHMIDIRQPFELELKGALPGALHMPFFHFKQHIGMRLDDEEQELLDADAPREEDVLSFVQAIRELEQRRHDILLLVCNSGRRSLLAAHLLRGIGYPQAYSVRGGMHALLPLLQARR